MGTGRIHTDTVREIRRRYALGYRISELVEGFGLSRTAVHGIVRGKTHKLVLDSELSPLATVEPIHSRERVRPPEAPPGELTPRYKSAVQELARRQRR